MANKVFNMEGGLHSAAAYSAFEDSMYGSSVASASDLAVTASTGMDVSISAGNGLISTGSGYARRIGTTAANTVTISAASSANPRIDSVVGYIDNSVTPVTSVVDNTNNILKFTSVSGTPAATPVAPNTSAIQTAIGAGNPYIILANVLVPKSATAASSFTFTDVRTIANEALDNSVATSAIQDSAVTTAKIDDGAVTSDKIDFTTLPRATVYTDTRQDSFNGIIPYDTFKQNVGGFTLSGGRLVVPKTGYYLVSATVAGFGIQGWLRVFVAAVSDSSFTASQSIASSIQRSSSQTYHNLVTASVVAYITAGQSIVARQGDSTGFDLNSGMDALIQGTTLTAVFLGD